MTFHDTTAYSLHAFATETLLARLQAMTREIEGVRQAEDIEFVHRMRVASRRLRTALGLFAACFPAKKAESWQGAFRRVTRALGTARDLDVQFAVVEEAEERLNDPRDRPGLARLLLRLRQRREKAQRGVARAMARLEDEQTIREMEEALRRLRVRDRLQAPETPSISLHALAETAIVDHLVELLSYEPYVTQPERKEELHAMRIAAKRLRYTLEVFAPLYDDGLKEFLKLARAVQDLLGEIHDCDVWALMLPDFLEEERHKSLAYAGHTRGVSRLAPGIQALQADRTQQRDASYRKFAALWKNAPDVWDALLKQIQPPAETTTTE